MLILGLIIGSLITVAGFAIKPSWAVYLNNKITGARRHISEELRDEAGKLADRIGN